MSESSGYTRPDDPPTAYRDPLTTTTDAYATSGTSTTGTAKQQAARVGEEAKQSGAHVAGVAKEQAAGVAQEAGRKAKDLLVQGRGQVAEQANQQKAKAASGITAIGDQLSALAGGTPQPGMVTDLAQQASQRISGVAQWIESRDASDLIDEVQRFARRRPGAFLAAAGVFGVLAGRLTRGVAANAHDDAAHSAPTSSTRSSSTGGTYTTPARDPYATSDTYGTTSTYSTVSGAQSTTGGTYQ